MADSAVVRSEWGSQLSEVVDGIGVGSAGMDALSTISAEGSGAGSDNGAGDSTTGGMDSEQAGDGARVEAVGVIASAC